MPSYIVRFITVSDVHEARFEAPDADACLAIARKDARKRFDSSDPLDEIVVGPDGPGDLDGREGVSEIYWTAPGFHERAAAQVRAVSDTDLETAMSALRSMGGDLSAHLIAKEYLRRRFKIT